MNAPENIEYTDSGGNVFADLDIADAEDALAKAELARAIGTLIAERRLTQVQAAVLLGIDQPKVSALLRGRLTDFSLDRLLRFLLALDQDVEIVIKPGAPRSGRMSVVALS
jgi:predicted XRE-type DNA-binding protein